MVKLEGKLKIWIKGGKFKYNSDLYVKVMCDDRKMWSTEKQDSYKPSWDATATRHIKGEHDFIKLCLMDDDTFSRDDLLGKCDIPFSCLLNTVFSKLEKTVFDGEVEMTDEKNEKVGKLRVYMEYMPGSVGMFQLMGEQFRKHEDD
eukprot:IDg12738t1